MVDISRETQSETNLRLVAVIQQSRLKLYDVPYAFSEFPVSDFQSRVQHDALALVRDDHVWSQLVPCNNAKEMFAIWRFHFPPNADNSGFVGWLASKLKQRFGTGVFVVCGQNSADGGIFDYWGCPWSLRDEVFEEVLRLVNGG
jgi:hypothetical protein